MAAVAWLGYLAIVAMLVFVANATLRDLRRLGYLATAAISPVVEVHESISYKKQRASLKSSDFYLVNYEVANCIVQFSNSRFESVLDNNGGPIVKRNNVNVLVHFCILKFHLVTWRINLKYLHHINLVFCQLVVNNCIQIFVKGGRSLCHLL